MIKIYRCDDSDAFNLRTITVNIDTSLSLVGATAKFSLVGFTQKFTTEQLNTKSLTIVIPFASAQLLPMGIQYGSLTFYDASNKVLTIFNRMEFLITNHVSETEESAAETASITVDSTTITINITVGTPAKSISYPELSDLPTVNGVTVTGDMTGDDLGLLSKNGKVVPIGTRVTMNTLIQEVIKLETYIKTGVWNE